MDKNKIVKELTEQHEEGSFIDANGDVVFFNYEY
jgi:hypothetical protein